MGKPLATALDRMRAYETLRAIVDEGSPTGPRTLAAKLREAGCVVPSRQTVRRWALGLNSPFTGKRIFVPRPSEDLSFFLGAWLGDGGADESDGGKRMLLKVRSYDFAKEFADRAARLLGKKDSYWVRRVTDKHGKWFLVKVTSFMLYDFVTEEFQRLTEFIEPFPRSFQRGFFTAEGNPSTSIEAKPSPWLNVGVVASNNNLVMLEFTAKMLTRLGYHTGAIRLNISKGERTNFGIANADGWLLNMSRVDDVRRFAQEIGFADSEKQEKLVDGLTLIEERGRYRAAGSWLAHYEKRGKKWVRKTSLISVSK